MKIGLQVLISEQPGVDVLDLFEGMSVSYILIFLQ